MEEKVWSATLTPEILKRYPNKYFIETGTHRGGGIQSAIDAGCFEEIHSIESDKSYFIESANRFARTLNVSIYLGSSVVMLPSILAFLDAPATFWLDAHFQDPGTNKDIELYPLLKEIILIGNHGKGFRHTVLVDDRRLLDGEWPVLLTSVVRELQRLHPSNVISYIDSRAFKQDIIVAEPSHD